MKKKSKKLQEQEEEFEEEEYEGEEEDEEEEYEEVEISSFEYFVQNNRNMIIIVSVVLIAAIGALFYFRSTMQTASKEASIALARIMPYYSNQNYELALNGNPQLKMRGEQVIGLLKIVDNYKSSREGKLAALYAGNCYLGLNKYDKAEEYFDIAKDSKSHLVESGAFAGLAVCHENGGNYEDAARNYKKAAEILGDVPARAKFKYYTGLCYEKSGEASKAETIYREIINRYEYSEFTGPAKTGLIRLGMIIE